MQPPLVSCIIPVFNGEKYLKEALDSVLAQTYRPLEVIVVDDGSTDATANIVQNHPGRISYLRQENRGIAAARKAGLDAAQGEYIAFLDADDLWHPNKLACQYSRLQIRPEIDLCFTRFQNFWMPELAQEEQRDKEHRLSQPSSAWSICTLMSHHSVFGKFSDFHDGTRPLEDMTWCLRVARQGAVIEVLSDVLMYRRFNLDSHSRRGRSQFLDGFFPILKEWRDYQRHRSDGRDRILDLLILKR